MTLSPSLSFCPYDIRQGVDATVDGVLGGYGSVSAADVASSKEFLQEVFGGEMRRAAANQQELVAVGECGSSLVTTL